MVVVLESDGEARGGQDGIRWRLWLREKVIQVLVGETDGGNADG